MKYIKTVIFIFFLGSCFFSFPRPAGEIKSETIAWVNHVPITRRDLDEKVNLTINRTYFHRHLPPDKKNRITKEAFNTLIEEELFFQESQRQNIRIDKRQIDLQYEKVVKKFPSKKDFKNAMKRTGYTPVSMKKKIERNMLIKEFYQQNITDRHILSEKQLIDYYENNKLKFKKPESIDLQLIFIKIDGNATKTEQLDAKKRAEGLYKRVCAGEDFDQLAAKFSNDRYRIKGGRMGEIHRGRLPHEVETVAFNLKRGEVSLPIKTERGYSIVKVLGKRESRLLGFDEIKHKLKKELEEKNMDASKKEWLTRLKDQAEIKILIKFDES